jgi:DNA-binding NarL/FixJ family response regulator
MMDFASAGNPYGRETNLTADYERSNDFSQTAIIVDRDAVAGEVMGRVLRMFGVTILKTLTTTAGLFQAVEEIPPSTMILDAKLPRVARVTHALVARHPRMAIAIVDDSFHNHQFNRALDSGAAAYLTKQDSIDELERVFRNFAVRPSSVIASCPGAKRCLHNPGILTDREIYIVRCRAQGLNAHASARALGICPEGLVRHEANAIGKLEALRQVKKNI